MGNLRFYFSLLFAKSAYKALQVTKLSSGTSIIGKLVLDICPNFLQKCNPFVKTKINITGTNGKTTTSGIISHILEENKNSIINNALGANMLTGVVNAIAVSLDTRKGAEYSVIESDEAYLSKIYNNYEADYLVVTNLFKDQLDRYGDISITKKLIQDGINKRPEVKLILNADDPMVSTFEGKNKIYYGVENVYYADESLKISLDNNETYDCECGKALNYTKRFYAKQGHYYCSCGNTRPNPKYNADITLYKDFSIIKIGEESFEIPLVGLFNAYNALAAIALCKELEIPNIQEHIKNFKVAFGRSEIKYLRGKKTIIQLIKNPIGANEVLKTIDTNSQLLIAVNDNYADGRDISWLWDVNFERLKLDNKEVVVAGLRAYDIALRLKYADIRNVKIISNLKEAIEYVGNSDDNKITILTTYTALLKINKMKELRSK